MEARLQDQIDKLARKVKALEKAQKIDNPKPKREPSAYNKFMSTEGPKVKKKNPDWPQADVMREVAKMWKAKNAK